MASDVVNEERLCCMTELETARYLVQLRGKYVDGDITAHLAASTESERIPPHAFCIWLTASKDNSALKAALIQSYSSRLRKSALRRVRHVMTSSAWRELWMTLGDTSGVLDMLAAMSAQNVDAFTFALGRCSSGPKRTERESVLEELIRGLLPEHYPDANYKTEDRRPLMQYYARIVPSCSESFVRSVLDDSLHPLTKHLSNERLLSRFPFMVRDYHWQALRTTDRTPFQQRFLTLTDSLVRRRPPLPTAQKHISASMEYSMRILRALAAADLPANGGLDGDLILATLIYYLMARLMKKRYSSRRSFDWTVVAETFDLVLRFLRQSYDSDPPMRGRIQREVQQSLWDSRNFLKLFIRAWALNPAIFEGRLIDLFHILRDSPLEKSPRLYECICYHAPRTAAYPLVKLMFLHLDQPARNIDLDADLKKMDYFDWPRGLLLHMDNADALAILRRLMQVSPRLQLWTYGGNDAELDPHLLLVGLEAVSSPRSITLDVNELVNAIMRRSERSRDAAERARHARSAMLYAIASGSVAILRSVMIWSRRFVRDALSVNDIFAERSFMTPDVIALLSGIPNPVARGTVATIKSGICEGNAALLELTETMNLASQQPFFSLGHGSPWDKLREIYRRVVEYRLEKARLVASSLDLSEGDLYDLLFRDTITMLLENESAWKVFNPRFNIHEHDESLLDYRVQFRFMHAHLRLPAVYRFIDDLAAQRDKVCRSERLARMPATASIPSPWTQGQTVEKLFGGWRIHADGREHMPFLKSRLAAVIYMKFEDGGGKPPQDQELRRAIAGYQESYGSLLKVYVLLHPEGNERKDAMLSAFSHATKLFRQDRTTVSTSSRTIRDLFVRTLSEQRIEAFGEKVEELLDVVDHIPKYPLLPSRSAKNSEQAIVWNLASDVPAAVTSLSLPLVNFDTFLDDAFVWRQEAYVGYSGFLQSARPPTTTVETAPFQPPPIWDVECPTRSFFQYYERERQYRNIRNTAPEVLEGLLVSALLYLDASQKEPSRLLSSAFPNASSVRYLPLSLHADIMANPEFSVEKALAIVSQLLDRVPPSLLRQLNNKSTPIDVSDSLARGLLALLAGSDRPQYACDPILRAIVEVPESSSWHRKILTKKFLRRLPAQDVVRLLTSLADKILEKLNEQSSKHDETSEGLESTTTTTQQIGRPPTKKPRFTSGLGESSNLHKPVIKITTVRFLAQLLQYADFVPTEMTITILSDLIYRATHIDSRVAITEAILHMFDQACEASDEAQTARLLGMLEAVVPIAGSLSERRPTRNEDWARAEQTKQLPEVWTNGGELSPLYDALFKRLEAWKDNWSHTKDAFVHRLVIPIIQMSASNNERWVRLFLASHDLDASTLKIPRVPINMNMIVRLLQLRPSLITGLLFEEYQDWVIYRLSPPKQIIALNEALHQASATDASVHWLSLYSQDVTIYDRNKFNMLVLLNKNKLELPSGTSLGRLQSMIIEQADVLIHNSSPGFDAWNAFLDDLQQPLGDPRRRELWGTRTKTIVERLLNNLTDLRSEQWSANPARTPMLLPPSHRLRLWLATGVSTRFRSLTEGEMKNLHHTLAAEVERVVQESGPYAVELADIKQWAVSGMLQNVELAKIFCPPPHELEKPTLMTFVWIDFARHLVSAFVLPKPRHREPPDEWHIGRLELANRWKASSNEAVRLTGFRLDEL